MTDDVQPLLDRLAQTPLPRRLDQLEADVLCGIHADTPFAGTAGWRVAAIAVALATGLGMGGSRAGEAERAAPDVAGLIAGTHLVPSSLLTAL